VANRFQAIKEYQDGKESNGGTFAEYKESEPKFPVIGVFASYVLITKDSALRVLGQPPARSGPGPSLWDCLSGR
jgi:hypothetical protein